MRRVVIGLVAFTLVLSSLISLKVFLQARALAAPSGGSGQIEAVVVDLASRVGARLLEVRVLEGQKVKAGELLVRLDCADPEALLAEAEARLATATAQAAGAAAQRELATRSKAAAGSTREAAGAQAASLAAQRDAAERQAKRIAATGEAATQAAIDQSKTAAEGLTHQAEAARAQVAATEAQIKAAAAGLGAAGAQLRAAQALTRAAEAAVARARLLVGECELRAPRDADVSKLPHEAGELVAPGAVLVRLVDLSAPRPPSTCPTPRWAR